MKLDVGMSPCRARPSFTPLPTFRRGSAVACTSMVHVVVMQPMWPRVAPSGLHPASTQLRNIACVYVSTWTNAPVTKGTRTQTPRHT